MRNRAFDPSRLPGFTIIAIAVFVLLYLPIATLVAYSFNGGESVAVWGGFSLDWYGRAWANETVKAAAIRSVVIAAWASCIATVLATLAAVGIVRNRGMKGRGLVYVAINQPLMVPEIVTAVALLIFFATIRQATGYQGLGYLIAAHAAFCVPFAYLPISARLEGMDATLEIAAADLYATPIQAFRYITLPLLMPGIAAGAMLAFVISLDDVIITEFVKSAGQDTLPTYMLSQMRRGVSPDVNAISTMLLVVTIILLAAFFLINRQTNRGKS